MLTHGSILVSLLWLVEQIPTPPPPVKRQRGRQEFYSDKLFVKALSVMIIRRLYTAYALLHFLEQDDPVALRIRPLLTEHGRFPTRRTRERRFATLPAPLPALIGCLGRHLPEWLQPSAARAPAVAYTRSGMGASKSDGSFTSYGRWPSSRSTGYSKIPLNGVVRCQSKA